MTDEEVIEEINDAVDEIKSKRAEVILPAPIIEPWCANELCLWEHRTDEGVCITKDDYSLIETRSKIVNGVIDFIFETNKDNPDGLGRLIEIDNILKHPINIGSISHFEDGTSTLRISTVDISAINVSVPCVAEDANDNSHNATGTETTLAETTVEGDLEGDLEVFNPSDTQLEFPFFPENEIPIFEGSPLAARDDGVLGADRRISRVMDRILNDSYRFVLTLMLSKDRYSGVKEALMQVTEDLKTKEMTLLEIISVKEVVNSKKPNAWEVTLGVETSKSSLINGSSSDNEV